MVATTGNFLGAILMMMTLVMSHAFVVPPGSIANTIIKQQSFLVDDSNNNGVRKKSILFSKNKKKPKKTKGDFAVSVEELEQDLTPSERSITSVVRKCAPTVAFVTSVWPQPATSSRRRRGGASSSSTTTPMKNFTLPEGSELGSGSGFLVDSQQGYVCTNFHVIESAYSIQQASQRMDTTLEEIRGNLTELLGVELGGNKNDDEESSSPSNSCPLSRRNKRVLPQVYVRINSTTKYQPCRIVGVAPEKDLAVLQLEEIQEDLVDGVTLEGCFGSSSDLLVGQTVVAIGNPFGLDKTVTSGIVSAVNREFPAIIRRERGLGGFRAPQQQTTIRNCIQTDAAINPGNSGGPLLNLQGQVVGINSAIITTSGSNAGIGFAVPSDQVKPLVENMIQDDMMRSQSQPVRDRGWLGISILKHPPTSRLPQEEDGQQGGTSGGSSIYRKNWVAYVEPRSPAQEAGIRPTILLETGILEWGDAIVAIGGNPVENLVELQMELKGRVVGEQVAITLEDKTGDRRVVYVTLIERPNSKQ